MSAAKQYTHASQGLLAHIDAGLQSARTRVLLGERGDLRVEALFSSPRADADVYGLAHAAGAPPGGAPSGPVRAYAEELLVTASWQHRGAAHAPAAGGLRAGASAEERGPPADHGVLMYALSLTVYTLPAHRSALVYVSKLDTTGHAPPPLSTYPDGQAIPREARAVIAAEWTGTRGPDQVQHTTLAKLLTESVLSYFVQLGHWRMSDASLAVDHVSLHVLARAQHAYLFPWSNKGNGKHLLTDKQLIRWWRDTISRAVLAARSAVTATAPPGAYSTKAFYLIPGYSQLESTDVISLPPPGEGDKTPLAQAQWSYGHPYTSVWPQAQGNPLPLHHPSVPRSLWPPDRRGYRPASLQEAALAEPSIASLIPTFDDDPKGRFLSELVEGAYDQTHVIKVGCKRAAEKHIEPETNKISKTGSHSNSSAAGPEDSLTRLPAGQLAVEQTQEPRASPSLTAGQKEAWKERSELDKVSAAEFWERMGFRQECNSGNAVGVFTLLIQRQTSPKTDYTTQSESVEIPKHWRTAIGALPGETLHELVIRLLLLDKNDWSSSTSATKLTSKWVRSISSMIQRRGEAPRSWRFPSEAQASSSFKNEESDEVSNGPALYKAISATIHFDVPPSDILTKAQTRHHQLQQEKSLNPSADTTVPAPRPLAVKRKKTRAI